MEPVFDAAGRPVAWLYQRQFLIDRSNVCRAFIRDRVLFLLDHRVIGSFSDGYVWDARGEAVAFVRGATNGPVLPAPHVAPPPPIPPAVSVPRLTPLVPTLSTHRMRWSPLTLETLLVMPATPGRPERRRARGRLGASFRATPAGRSAQSGGGPAYILPQ